jgi:hypothetical protein
MPRIVFYSWQSDLPNATNRGFIQAALEQAAENLAAEGDPQIEPVLDRDTAGVAGAPDIGHTIFKKIENSAALVCDVSIVNSDSAGSRQTPNPNVLIELGFGLKALGANRIVLVMNTQYGGPGTLPFDLRQKRVITYSIAETEAKKASSRKALAESLSRAIKAILLEILESEANSPKPQLLSVQASESISAGRPDQGRHITNFMRQLAERLKHLDPHQEPGIADDNLVQAIGKTVPLVQEFERVTDTVSAMNSQDGARALCKGFEYLLTLCYLPKNSSRSYKESDFDLFRFVANELVITLTAYLMRDERWTILDNVLQQPFHIPNAPGASLLSFRDVSYQIVLLDQIRTQRLMIEGRKRISIHADILKERHDGGLLSGELTWEEFLDADMLLFLKSFGGQNRDLFHWWPPTAIYLGSHVPRYLAEATTVPGAIHLAGILGVTNAGVRTYVTEALAFLRKGLSQMGSFQHLWGFEPGKIAMPTD